MSSASASFDLVWWSSDAGVGAVEAARRAYRMVDAAVRSQSVGEFLASEEGDEGNEIALGGDLDGCWLVDRWMSPLRPRKDPLKSLIASGAEVARVLWTTEMEYLELGRWSAGKMVRTLRLGLDGDIAQGRIQPFESGIWDGTIAPEPEFELVDKPRAEWIDEQQLIARERSERLTKPTRGRS